jgi:hypothetical protein
MPADGTGDATPRRRTPSRLAPAHGSLPLLAEERFPGPIAPHRLVTFLTRSLKRRGLIFGLSQEGDEVRLSIYETRDDERESGKEGEQIGDERGEDRSDAR